MNERLINEIRHGERIVGKAREIWGWSGMAGEKRWRRRVGMLTSHIRPGMRVLEIGCGTGLLTDVLCQLGAEVVAVDVSGVLIEQAKQNSKNNIEFIVADVCELKERDASFDFVVGSSVLHHLDIDRALCEIFRVLKKRGEIRFTEPNMLNPQIAVQKNIPFAKKWLGDSPDETAFFRWMIARKIKEAGFFSVNVVPFDFLHPKTPKITVSAIERLSIFIEKIPVIKEISGSLFIRATK